MSDLKALMQEYRERINDPTYVAPAELRNMNKKPMTAQVQLSDPRQELIQHTKAQSNSITPMKESERMFVKNQAAGAQSYLNEIAKSLGVKMNNGAPELSAEQESEMNTAIDAMLAGSNLDPRQEKWNDLMTDWKD